MKIKIIIITIILFQSTLSASSKTSTAEFLLIQPYAKGASLGGAIYSPVGNDVNIQYNNPAGLGLVNKYEISFTHSFLFADLYMDYISACLPIRDFGTFGAGFVMMGMSDTVAEVGLDGLFTGDNIEFDNQAANLAYSTPKLFDTLLFGLNFKYYSMKLHKETFSGLSFDMGVSLLILNDLLFGIAVKDIEFDSSTVLPLAINTGIGYSLQLNKDISLNPSMGISLLKLNYFKINLNTEFVFNFNEISCLLRAGYSYPAEADFVSGLGTGIGIMINKKYKIDYGFKPSSELGMEHRISLVIGFGELAPIAKKKTPIRKNIQESNKEIFYRAARYRNLKLYNKALLEYRKIITRDSKNIKAAYNIASLYSIKNNIKYASMWIKYVLKLDSSLIDRIENDPDFENFINSDGYPDLLKK